MNICNFTKADVQQWEIENDVVMGGKSRSEIHHINSEGLDMMKFTGHVSLENDGGFAQTQCHYAPHLDVSAFSQIMISGTGDGKTYTLRFETDDREVAYESKFIADKNFEAIIKFESLKKVFHGEAVPDRPDFNSAKVKTICLLIGNGVEEDFEIALTTIVALV